MVAAPSATRGCGPGPTGPRRPSTSPTPRYGETLAYSPAIDELVLLGGQTTGGYDNSTWVWNSAGTNWAQLGVVDEPLGTHDAGHGL